MCKMRRSKTGSYVRDGMSVEVIANSLDDYQELMDRGLSALDFGPVHGMVFKLFTVSGAMLPDSSSWTLGEYLKRVKKGEAKLGIGCIEVSC